jgi:hypothetical protein
MVGVSIDAEQNRARGASRTIGGSDFDRAFEPVRLDHDGAYFGLWSYPGQCLLVETTRAGRRIDLRLQKNFVLDDGIALKIGRRKRDVAWFSVLPQVEDLPRRRRGEMNGVPRSTKIRGLRIDEPCVQLLPRVDLRQAVAAYLSEFCFDAPCGVVGLL